MTDEIKEEVLDQYAENLEHTLAFKVVVFSEEDLKFATWIHQQYPEVPFYISCGTPVFLDKRNGYSMTPVVMERYRWLVDQVLKDPALHKATVLPQLHAMLWGNAKGK